MTTFWVQDGLKDHQDEYKSKIEVKNKAQFQYAFHFGISFFSFFFPLS